MVKLLTTGHELIRASSLIRRHRATRWNKNAKSITDQFYCNFSLQSRRCD